MAETAAKKLKTSSPLIGTHNGHFHADEALAVYLLRLLPAYSSSPLVRTRDPTQLETCHTVVDVGGVYDAAINRYDHHQRTFSTTFPQHNTKLSSAGLVYMHFGRSIIAQNLSVPEDHANVDLLYEKLYTDFIEAIDANDNGISAYDSAALAAASVEKRFKDGGVTLASIVNDMNNPDPTSPPGEPQDEDSLFGRASTLIGNVFARKLHSASTRWLPARATVGAAYKSRTEAHPSGRILVLPEGGVPWKEHLYNFEKDASTAKGDPAAQVYYVLYPESGAEDSKWRVQCVSETESSFVSRKPLPEAWRGVRDQDLDAMIASEAEKNGQAKIPEGAVFVHASGFIGGHRTREGAMAMAVRGLE
ncbi:Metal-dependent protein hydrolase [Penicillium taxi]|uniref:Metal-dependent protein hydrolase n=1 Tax=Penicillium taxi TaxID=168475 RepID=UPI0025459548|nr:Metal-dependent protein hydrolase [Penicillium taxi]KAJ5909030.1 Metal-dependent protein hydrolase [Penicillium taxi]